MVTALTSLLRFLGLPAFLSLSQLVLTQARLPSAVRLGRSYPRVEGYGWGGDLHPQTAPQMYGTPVTGTSAKEKETGGSLFSLLYRLCQGRVSPSLQTFQGVQSAQRPCCCVCVASGAAGASLDPSGTSPGPFPSSLQPWACTSFPNK